MSPHLDRRGDNPTSPNNSVRKGNDSNLLRPITPTLLKHDAVTAASDPEEDHVEKAAKIVQCRALLLCMGTFSLLEDDEDEQEEANESETRSDDDENVQIMFHLHSDATYQNNKVEQEKLQLQALVAKDEEQCFSVDTSITDISTTSWSTNNNTPPKRQRQHEQKYCLNREELKPSLYMRVTDLLLSLEALRSTCIDQQGYHDDEHEHLVKPQSLPNLDDDSSEFFIALNSIVHDDNNDNKYSYKNNKKRSTITTMNIRNPCPKLTSPLMEGIIKSLTAQSLEFACNPNYWIFFQQSLSSSFTNYSSILPSSSSPLMQFPQLKNNQVSATVCLSREQIQLLKKEVLLWSNKTSLPEQLQSSSSFYTILTENNNKHNLVAIRSLGIVENKRPKDIYDLLLDSKRVKEYNQYGIGRDDIWIYNPNGSEGGDDTVGNRGCNGGYKKSTITKVCHGQNKPPLVRKPFSYMTFFHGEELQSSSLPLSPKSKHKEGNGYMLITRSVKQVDSNGVVKDAKLYNTEIMLGCTLFLSVQCTDDTSMDCSNLTFLVNANYAKSPMPCYITRKVALSAAGSFLNCLRSSQR